jgi:hypothetical protein
MFYALAARHSVTVIQAQRNSQRFFNFGLMEGLV